MTKTRAGVSAFGTAAALGALLMLAPGLASAQDYPPGNPSPPPSNAPSDAPGNPPTSQPPAQPCAAPDADPEDCREPGRTGAGADAPPLVVSRTSGAPGDQVDVSVADGYEPFTDVNIGLVRMTTGTVPDKLGTEETDESGGFESTVTIPEDAGNGVYVLYSEGTAPDSDDSLVSTTSFIVNGGAPAAAAGAARTGGKSGTTSGATITAADLPASWTPPKGWTASPEVQLAVTEAINFRLAALKTELPDVAAAPADAAAGTTSSSDDDLTPWYAGGAALALLAATAVGWRRRSMTSGRTAGEASA